MVCNMTEEKHKTMHVKDATILIEKVKEAIMDICDDLGIVIADEYVHPIQAVEMVHEDRFDMYGDYGCVELRVYWRDE